MSFAHSTSAYPGLQASTSSYGFSTRQNPPPPKPAPSLDLPALQSASRVLQEQFVKDAQTIPDTCEILTAPPQSSASYSVFPDDYRVPFQKKRMIPIPDSLFQYYDSTEVVSHMGILSELERAWIAIDHKLFLWDYVDGQELSSFMDQPDVITHVIVVKPKPGVFVDEINHLLVLCTPLTIVLLGVSTVDVPGPNHRTRKEIKLFATDISVSCDVEMVDVTGTDDGRIFMAGSQDGGLYELHYQEKEGWFGRRVQLINHSVAGVQSFLPRFTSGSSEDRIVAVVADRTRNIIYTLTSNSVISLYAPTRDKTVHLYQKLTGLYSKAQDKAPGSPALAPGRFQIAALHVIPADETQTSLQLMAITANGIRLYFAATPSPGSYYSGSSNEAPRGHRSIVLVHVRLPPPNLLHPDEQSNPYHPRVPGYNGHAQPPSNPRPYIVSTLENSIYSAGMVLAAQPGDVEGTDFLLCLSPDLTRIGTLGQAVVQQVQYPGAPYGAPSGAQRPPLTERAAMLAIPGRTWGMAAVVRPKTPYSANPGAPVPAVTNELALQFSESPRQFMVLTNAGVTILAKRRALDWLRDVIEEVQAEGNVQPIVQFRDSFGRDQTCAMLLALASGNTFLDLGDQSGIGTITTLSAEVANVAKQAFYDCGERPMWAERMAFGTGDASGTALFSGRRQGFALYFARLVWPIWKTKLIKPGPLGLHVTNISEDTLFTVQKNLFALKEFLEKNPHLFHSATGDYAGARAAPASDQEAWKVEQSSVAQLQALLARTIEGAAFFLLLNDHRIGELIAQTDSDTQKLITALTFEELVTGQNGVTASRALVNVVIDQQIGQQIAVDTISDVLQSRCGSFCSTDDVMLYKAKENIRRAVESRNPAERQNHLGESLRLFMKGARILDFEKLREVVGEYQQLDYAKGAVELPLHCAETADTDRLGQEFWRTSAVPPTSESASQSVGAGAVVHAGNAAWDRRARCYDLVLDSLQVFEGKAASQGEGAERVRAHAYELAFASSDEMFHSRLYDWLISRGLADELLEMRPAYLEAHLQREPTSVDKLQLLWQFYVKDGQPLKAAEVLGALAESAEFPLPLSRRIEYLTLAVGNAKSHPVAVGGRPQSAIDFLTELEEKLEVSQVQLEIYNTLAARAQAPNADDPDFRAKVELLERGLFSVTELYQVYADPYDLHTIKLLILHVSQHHDDRLVNDIWTRVFDETVQGVSPAEAVDRIQGTVVPLGQRFYPSDAAFPFSFVATLLVNYQLAHADVAPPGWVPRILIQCGVPYAHIWPALNKMYESQVPPFNTQPAVQTLSGAICILLQDWLDVAKRSPTEVLPVDKIDTSVEMYLRELAPGEEHQVTRSGYERIRRELRRNW
ncbi:nucleoporin [Auriscalpium vulgare]|uniref:Nucleoporin n=1 Tax=Auriscalpium vulgare TaxID=40419 RepID=A0ACB8SAX6_9AGAM|nr:nucleoporin [Auriscalpium vulgare]